MRYLSFILVRAGSARVCLTLDVAFCSITVRGEGTYGWKCELSACCELPVCFCMLGDLKTLLRLSGYGGHLLCILIS